MVLLAIIDLLPLKWPRKLAQFVETLACDHEEGIWLVRNGTPVAVFGIECHMAILINGHVYEIDLGGQRCGSSLGKQGNWKVYHDETYSTSDKKGWVRMMGNEEVVRTREELVAFAMRHAGSRYDLLFNNCQKFCFSMYKFAIGMSDEPLDTSVKSQNEADMWVQKTFVFFL